MPAYAKDGKVICFEGAVWPIYFALAALTGAEETRAPPLSRKQ